MHTKELDILIIEDNEGDFVIFKEYLHLVLPKVNVKHADSLLQGIEIVENEPIDVILLDLTLPDGMGIDTFNAIYAKAAHIPIVILTGLQDTELALESLHIGAQDYIAKDGCTPALLAKSINYGIERSKMIRDLKRNEMEKELLIEELTQNNSDLRQFSYITSHNLRAPLSNLLGILSLIDMNVITDEGTVSLLENFKECTQQLNDTVNDLINVLIIKNNVNAKVEALDVSVMFEKVVHSIQNNLSERQVKIDTDFSEVKEIAFNRSYLESILLNLLTNAVKYSSPNRQPHISVRTQKTTEGVQLFFNDNGLGIDLNRHRDKIFGLYQRFHDHADSKGLGLYIVNSQIRVLGGEIEIESEVDKGTTFIITFKN